MSLSTTRSYLRVEKTPISNCRYTVARTRTKVALYILGMIRMLSEHNPPIGVFFESENIFSLNDQCQMGLSFQATMAEEESRNKSRSMEASLRMRLDHGLLLTPKLLGFMHDEEGHLIPDPRTMHLPKLIFFMYL